MVIKIYCYQINIYKFMRLLLLFMVLTSCGFNNQKKKDNNQYDELITISIQRFDDYINLKYPNYSNPEEKIIAFLDDYEKLITSFDTMQQEKIITDFGYFNDVFLKWENSSVSNLNSNNNPNSEVLHWLKELNSHYEGKPFQITYFKEVKYNMDFYYYLYHKPNTSNIAKDWIRDILILQMSPVNAVSSLHNPKLYQQLNSDDFKILIVSEFIIPILENN